MKAQGLTFDWKNLEIKESGAIFLKFAPPNALLTVNSKTTKYSKRSLIQSNSVIIKNLPPGRYALTLSKEGFHPWEKNLNVESGIITSATQIQLWPNEIKKKSPLKKGVLYFWLTSKGIVYKNEEGKISFEGSILRGEEVVLALEKSKLIVTREGKQNYFLIDLEEPGSAINLTYLFNSLKQRNLNLPGVVPIQHIFFHPFNSDKLIITSQTSLYIIDFEKIQIEKLITLPEIKAVSLNVNEALLFDKNGKLVIVNLLLKTSSVETSELGGDELTTNALGTRVLFLTAKGDLKLFNRASKTAEELAVEVKAFYLSPEEKRVAVVTNSNKIKIIYLTEYKSDLKYPAGTVLEIPEQNLEEINKLTWLPKFPNYLMVLKDNNLIMQELDLREPPNSYLLFKRVKNYRVTENKLYLLTQDGELNVFAIAEAS